MGGCQSICSKEPKKKVPEPTSPKDPENAEEEEQVSEFHIHSQLNSTSRWRT